MANPFLTKRSSEDLAKLEKAGFKNQIPDMVKLEETGDSVEGEFVDRGDYETTDPKTGEVKKVAFYTFRHATGPLFRINGLTILDKGLSAVKPGQQVIIIKRPDVKTSAGRKAADFAIFVK